MRIAVGLRNSISRWRVIVLVAIGVLAAIATGTAQAAVVYPNWVIEPDNQTTATPATGVVLFDAKGAPDATYSATKTDSTGTTALGTAEVIAAGTPWGKAFGTSAGETYLEVVTHGPTATATATFVFLQPIAPGGWGFTLGDIDVDQVQINATSDGSRRLSGDELIGRRSVRTDLSGNQVQGAVPQAPYNYLGGSGAKPTWATYGDGGELVGTGAESDGAAGWFMPSAPVKTLTLTFSRLPGGTDPVAPQSYQLWFAMRTHVISGSVVDADTSMPMAGVPLTLADPTGAIVGTVRSDKRGRYRIGRIYERAGYTLTATPPSGLYVIGSTARVVNLSSSDKTVNFVLTRSSNEPDPVVNPTKAQIKPKLDLAFDAAQVDSEATVKLTATYRNPPAALGAATIAFTLPPGLTLRASTCARVANGVVTIDIANLQPLSRSCAMMLRAASSSQATATVAATLTAEVAPAVRDTASASVTIVPAGSPPTPVTG